MFWYFVFFLISGFCGILYELVWLRLAMAQFGVTTAQVSIVLSAFMGGLGLGSIASGRLVRHYGHRIRFPPLRFYAAAELLIGVSALVVPYQLLLGHRLLARVLGAAEVSSLSYLLMSAAWVALTLVPWCALMGATIPLAMFAIRSNPRLESSRSFSFLYASNVAGAVAGAIVPLAIIELRGFHFTLKVGMLLNAVIAACALAATLGPRTPAPALPEPARPRETGGDRRILGLLFMTGLASMGMEVVWIRLFTPLVGVLVYSFAMILVTYLVATFLGSLTYNGLARIGRAKGPMFLPALAVFAVLPVWAGAPSVHLARSLWADVALRLAAGIAPFAFALGYLTPKLVDDWSGGDADRAGRAYAANVLGCILGPLLSGFVLLPLAGERWVLLMFAVPWLFIGGAKLFYPSPGSPVWMSPAIQACSAILTLLLASSPKGYERAFHRPVIRRDHTATVIAAGSDMQKRLVVNGVAITTLTPTTKAMAHLPLALLDHAPSSALVICFGMGTTFRSVLSWGIEATGVDLVPSVPELFWYFHSDAPEVLRSPHAHVVIDDGRRYLERTSEQFDVITIDPPPPVSAAGSSLLYSTEFYRVAKQRLRPHGMIQQWLPASAVDPVVRASVAQAVKVSFPYVRVFQAFQASGYHLVASDSPLPDLDGQQLARKLGPAAERDFVEWGPESTARGQFDRLLASEIPLSSMIAGAPAAPPIADDRPINEYFVLRNPPFAASQPAIRGTQSLFGETRAQLPR